MANATFNNTSSFATKFLETIACNRAFVRAVRNFLNVHIVGDDEIDKSDPSQKPQMQGQTTSAASISPNSMLESAAQKFLSCDSFEDFKESLRSFWSDNSYRNDKAKEWTCYTDIPPKEARVLLKIVKN